jgi:hypothetical protein
MTYTGCNALFDHLVGDEKQRQRHVEAECLGGLRLIASLNLMSIW